MERVSARHKIIIRRDHTPCHGLKLQRQEGRPGNASGLLAAHLSLVSIARHWVAFLRFFGAYCSTYTPKKIPREPFVNSLTYKAKIRNMCETLSRARAEGSHFPPRVPSGLQASSACVDVSDSSRGGNLDPTDIKKSKGRPPRWLGATLGRWAVAGCRPPSSWTLLTGRR